MKINLERGVEAMKRKKQMIGLLLLTIIALLLCGCTPKQETVSGFYTSIEELEGKRVGVETGTIFDDYARKYIKNVTVEYYNNYPDLTQALELGKIDCYLVDEPLMRVLIDENPNQRPLSTLEQDCYGFIFQKTDRGAALRDQFNEYIALITEDGTLQKIDSVWFGNDESVKTVDLDSLTGENGTLKYATSSLTNPFSYIKDGKIVGYEIDIVARFCKAYGYALEITDSNFAGLLASVSNTKCDFGSGCISITDERKEMLYFSEPYYTGGIVIVVKGSAAPAAAAETITSLDDLEGKRVAMVTGVVFDTIVPNYVKNPQFVYVNSTADACAALEMGRADAYAADEPVAVLAMEEYPDHRILKKITDENYAFIIGQNERKNTLYSQFNEYLAKIRENGIIDELKNIWVGKDKDRQVIDFTGLSGENGTLTFVTTTDSVGAPFSYVSNGQFCGYDIDMAVRFCREYGYGIDIQDMNFPGMLASLTSGKADFGAGCVSITEERRKSGLLFTDPNYVGGVALVVRNGTPSAVTPADDGGIMESFEKTFIREARWKLFASGIGITVLITALSVIFGTVIGFLLFLMYRKNHKVFNGIMNVIIDILEKTPVVVIQMILYYVIFGKSNLDGIWVSTVGFSLMFACSFISTLKVGVLAVDRGQTEASLSLGFKDTHGFLCVVLPQAQKHFLPYYRGNIVSLLKDTAIVGYIAVQDLTKVGDIIRSRTYEAFFPLIATAAIYFLLAWLLTLLVRRIEFHIEPTHRSIEKILKGVKTK